jgi:nuclease-like protein/UvrD-like helicase family protein/AAA domain-containing protein
MATFLSHPRNAAARATPGELRVAERLEQFLEDDYLCWYDVPIGPKHQHPDVLILHPGRGILILEIKDWKIDQIREVSPKSFTMDFGGGHQTKVNPIEQARAYAHVVVDLLKRDRQLLQDPDSPYAGNLCFPWGYGLILTNITRNQFDSQELCSVLPPHLVICKDEMTESADAEHFQKRLWDMFNVQFTSKLTMPQVDRIRALLFPEIRIQQSSLLLGATQPGPGTRAEADLLQVMDLQQESIARGLGEGHRIIHGVAGSGKTLILAYRCQYLAQMAGKPILVLVYNKALASWLNQQMLERGISDRVTVRNFHAWCHDQLMLYHVPIPPEGPDFYGRMVEVLIRAVERGQIPRAQYGALLIDEGHDLEADWLKLVVQMLDPETNSLLLLYDDAQSIYGQRRSSTFSFRSLGISASGRTKILKRNYRNTDEILECAREFAKEILEPKDADDDHVPSLMPESGGRKGPIPRFGQFQSTEAEANKIAQELLRLHRAGTPWGEMGVFYTALFVGQAVKETLDHASIPVDWLKDSVSKNFNPRLDSVRLMTAHSSKGLQYQVVIVAGAGFLPYRSERDDAKVMYVALTRATHELIITTSKTSSFSQRLKALCDPLAA